MKNAIFIVTMISLTIIFLVFFLTFQKEHPEIKYDVPDTYQNQTPDQNLSFSFAIVTSEPNFWDRVAALKTTEALEEETPVLTDEEGNPVTDEEGNPVTAVTDQNGNTIIISDDSQSDNEAEDNTDELPVTKVPKYKNLIK